MTNMRTHTIYQSQNVSKTSGQSRSKWQTILKLIVTFSACQKVTRQAMYVWRNNESLSRNYCCSGTAISSTYLCVCVCVREPARGRMGVRARAWACARVTLLIQHATRMRHVVTSFVAPLAPPYLSTLSHFREKATEHKMRILILSTNFLQNISHSQNNLARCKVVTFHFTKAHRGSRGIAPFILKLGIRRRRVVNFTPRPLYPRERITVFNLTRGWEGLCTGNRNYYVYFNRRRRECSVNG